MVAELVDVVLHDEPLNLNFARLKRTIQGTQASSGRNTVVSNQWIGKHEYLAGV
jgi:hypothetical protein